MQSLNLEYLDQYQFNLKDIYNEIIDLILGKYTETISILAIGSTVKGNFSYNEHSSRKTLSDIELVIVTDDKIGQEKLNYISNNSGRRWFTGSELFHIDIRESTEKELFNRENLLPFKHLEVISGIFDKARLISLANKSTFQLENIVEKNIYQYAIFNAKHNNREVSWYTLIKLCLEIAECNKNEMEYAKTILDLDKFRRIKSSIEFNNFNEDDINNAKYYISRSLKMFGPNHYFTIDQIEEMINTRDVDNHVFSIESVNGFIDHYYQSKNNPQVNYFNNIYATGNARAI